MDRRLEPRPRPVAPVLRAGIEPDVHPPRTARTRIRPRSRSRAALWTNRARYPSTFCREVFRNALTSFRRSMVIVAIPPFGGSVHALVESFFKPADDFQHLDRRLVVAVDRADPPVRRRVERHRRPPGAGGPRRELQEPPRLHFSQHLVPDQDRTQRRVPRLRISSRTSRDMNRKFSRTMPTSTTWSVFCGRG